MQNILITGLATLDLIFKLDKFPVKNEKYRATGEKGTPAEYTVIVTRILML